MASLGYYLLLAAFVVCAYAAAISVAGARRRSTPLIESGVGAFYLLTAIMGTASAIIEYSFIAGDYSIKYVQHYSDSVQPLFYRITSYWGGLDGSIMFWVFMLSLFGSAAVYINRERHRELIPYVVAVIAVVEMFFLFLMVIHNNPFETFLTEQHADGQGLNPLLQNFYMAIHPPMLYLGFVGLTIPYAFGMAALITGHLDDSWLRAVRRWTMVAWLFLSLGLMLGMLWAYEVLGWGGYWGWDPVENAAALPWFTATAFLHSVMVQERRGMLRVWNVTLVITTFFLTIVGTFLTRSGVVQSVHAFGDDPALARLFAIFMVTILVVSFGFVIYRLPLLRARNELDSWVSREAAFLANNWILLIAAFFVLFATMFPTITEAVTGERITVGAPFYNKWMLPIGLTLLVLTGVGPLLAWRKSTLTNLREQFLMPIVAAVVVGGAVVALGVRLWSAGLCFALCGFVACTIAQEFWRGAKVRKGATGTDIFTALVGLVARNRRRYGGYIVHVGIVLIFLGFAGNGFKREETALLKPGQAMKVGDFTIRYNGLKVTDDGQKQMVTGSVMALQNGKELARMYPARWYFRKHESEPTTQVAIHRGFGEDLYLVMAAFTPQDQTASIEAVVNPLVNWVWLGFGILAVGTAIAFMPESAFAFATVSVPANAATTGMILLALVLWPVAARAGQQQGGGHMVYGDEFAPLENRTPVEKSVGRKLICMCGDAGCGKQLAGECNCSFAAQMRSEIAQMAHQGKTEDQIVGFYLAKYGSSEVLAEPPNRGFTRLSWLFPYAVGVGGLVTIFFVARRWTRPSSAVAGMDSTPVDPELDARLDDELRNLD